MAAHARTPRAPLSGFVDLLWFQSSDDLLLGRQRVLPDGSAELIVNLGANAIPIFGVAPQSAPSGVLCGPHSASFEIEVSPGDQILGVHFKVGGVFPFFGCPASELHNRVLPLETLWGDEAHLLRARLLEAPTLRKRFGVLESFLLERLTGPRTQLAAFAVGRIQAACGDVNVARLSEHVGVSSRRLSEVFKAQVGLSPKRFARLQRLQRALRLSEAGPSPDWLEISALCGYFDQAHFVHDFRAFTGLTPTAYLERRSGRLNHLLG